MDNKKLLTLTKLKVDDKKLLTNKVNELQILKVNAWNR